jgi:hypothetical protein
MKLTDLVRPLVQQKAIIGLTGGGGTKLDGIVTLGLALSPVPVMIFAIGSEIVFYFLRAGTDAEASPDIIRPDDYAGGSNEKVWEKFHVIYADATGLVTITGALTLSPGRKLTIASGANQRAGNAVLVAGTVAVANTTVTANTVVMLTRKTAGGTIGSLTYTLNAGVGFTINSSDPADTSTISYLLIEVA